MNAILVRLLPGVDAKQFAQDIARWKHLAALTQEDQETVLSRSVIDRARRQIGLFTTLLLTVSTVIIGLIIYTMTIDKKKSIATLKLIGAPDRTIVGLIVQQALAMGMISFLVGAALINAGQGYFPRRVVLEPADAAILSVWCCSCACSRARSACAPHSRSIPLRRWRADHGRAAGCRTEGHQQAFRRGTGARRCAARGVVRRLSRHGHRLARAERVGQEHACSMSSAAFSSRIPAACGSTARLVYDSKWLRSDLRSLRLEKIGFIFQSHNLLPFLNAWENIAVARILAGASAGAGEAARVELLAYLGIERRKNAMPGELSGGEAQRIAIARALANDPRIILADEPTAALDSQRAGTVMDLLRKVATERRTAVIVVTHDEKIFNRFDHIYALRDGALEVPKSQAA